jgi:AraC-like DNA-binding protein
VAAEATVLAGIITPLIQAGASAGISRAEVNRLLERDAQLMTATLRVEAVQRLLKAIVDRGYDAVTAAAGVRCNDVGVGGFLLQTAPTARQAIEAVPAFYPLVSNFGSYRLTETGTGISLAFEVPRAGSLTSTAWLVETALISTAAIWREAFGSFQLAHVRFRHPAPPRRGSHARLFGCAVHFGADENSLEVPHALLERRTKMANPAMCRYFTEHAQAELASLGRRVPFSDRVRACILEGIAGGSVSAPVVARQLGMSERSLRRRLEESGYTFRVLLEQTRMAAADRLLGDGDRTVSEIASDLGFSEASAFSRFYRRQQGMSPRRRWPGQKNH